MFFSFLNKPSPVFPIGGILGVDIHSHLVPGIDDGAHDSESSAYLIDGLRDLGYTSLITTPHISSEYYPNNSSTIQAPFNTVLNELKGKDTGLSLKFAAEYLMDEKFSALTDAKELLTLKENYVLVETGFMRRPINFELNIFNLQSKGYIPVLAHPERYHYFHDLRTIEEISEKGVLLQVNLLSFTGYYGEHEKRMATSLLVAGLIDLLGTDLHNERQLYHLKEFRVSNKIKKLLENGAFKNNSLFGD